MKNAVWMTALLLVATWTVPAGLAEAEKKAEAEAKPEAQKQADEAAKSDKLVELKLEIPRPMFDGTPKNMPGARLDPNRRKTKRPAVMVEPGVTLLSRKKPVTIDEDNLLIGDAGMVTDGDKDPAMGAIEFFPGCVWVQIDLEQRAKINKILVWHFFREARVYRDVIVQVSDDPEFKKGVKTVFNNDHDNSSELGQGKDYEYIETNEGFLIDAKDVIGRYVRLYTNGNTLDDSNHIIEAEVFGIPLDKDKKAADKSETTKAE